MTEEIETDAPDPNLKYVYLKRDIAWYLTLLLLILVTCSPGPLCFLYYLSTVPDVTWQRGDLTYDRLWMVRAPGPAGLGYERQRVKQSLADDRVCVANTVRYFLWQAAGEAAEGVRFSQVFRETANGWQPTGESCN
jgi:hypothetical protein